jgi:hypothetical protein
MRTYPGEMLDNEWNELMVYDGLDLLLISGSYV